MEQIQINIDTLWTVISAILVFFMQAGFMALESVMVRSKNSINVAAKNFADFMISTIAFFIFGYALMFGTSFKGFFGTDGFLMRDVDYTFWFFHIVFAGTSATIVSGAIAERAKFAEYLIISLFVSGFIYPVFGHWSWASLSGNGIGRLENLGFLDFAGSSVVHSIGGWTALAGVIVLGPRIGKYTKDGKVKQIPAQNLAMATLGVFILWFGWFRFNGGSTNAVTPDIGKIIVNTNISAVSGGIVSMFMLWIIVKKP